MVCGFIIVKQRYFFFRKKINTNGMRINNCQTNIFLFRKKDKHKWHEDLLLSNKENDLSIFHLKYLNTNISFVFIFFLKIIPHFYLSLSRYSISHFYDYFFL